MNFMFSAKELDKETGFYYYGARYLDPKYSRWISCDPAMNTGEYFPVAPTSDEARQHNGNLPGMGGIFNHINGNLFAYAGNNPVKYTDPDGRENAYQPEYFNGLNYMNQQLNALGAGFYIAFRQVESYVGNFFANIFTGKGDAGIVASGSVKVGDVSYGCTITGTVKKGFSLEFDDLKSTGLAALQSALGDSPITINIDGISVQYKIAKATVSVDSSNASFKLELTTGKNLKVGELSAVIIVTAPYTYGPCATIQNRKSESLNQAVDYYQYATSPECYLDNLE